MILIIVLPPLLLPSRPSFFQMKEMMPLEMKEKILGLDKERFNTYQKILPAEDLIRYYDLEQEFKTEMTQKFEASKRVSKPANTQTIKLSTPTSSQKSITIEAHPQQK